MKLELKQHPIHPYLVSECGRIFSKTKTVNHNYGGKAIKKGKELTQYTTKQGYVNVGLTINKKVKVVRVHRMVAETWIEKIKDKPMINHKDLNKANNHKNNLEWCTQKENINHYWNAKKQSTKTR